MNVSDMMWNFFCYFFSFLFLSFFLSFLDTHRSTQEVFLLFCGDARAHLMVYLEAGSHSACLFLFRFPLSLSFSLYISLSLSPFLFFLYSGSLLQLLPFIDFSTFPPLEIHPHNASVLLLADVSVDVCAETRR